MVEKANAHTDPELARGVYNQVIATVKCDKPAKRGPAFRSEKPVGSRKSSQPQRILYHDY